MVAGIRSSAVLVSSTGRQISSGSAALAQRTDEQAASLRQFVTTVGMSSDAVAANANDAEDLTGVTAALHQQAQQGHGVMTQTIASLAELKNDSRKVAEIIGVIDRIAFQTNILALNAAVEAARAGESGRVFAVVAAEVRLLAKRSAEAAGEIRQLIGRSREQVDSTVARVQLTGTTLRDLLAGVSQVSERLHANASSIRQQSRGLAEMAAAVGNLDEITRNNAVMVEESQAASTALTTCAASMAEAVGTMRLRQGGADEARGLVARAMTLVARDGRSPAEAAMRSPDKGLLDRDLYLFVVDREGRYCLHGANQALEGNRLHDIPGIDADKFVREVFAAAQAGGGWVDYRISHPQTREVTAKASWVQSYDNQSVIGCGIHKEHAVAPA